MAVAETLVPVEGRAAAGWLVRAEQLTLAGSLAAAALTKPVVPVAKAEPLAPEALPEPVAAVAKTEPLAPVVQEGWPARVEAAFSACPARPTKIARRTRSAVTAPIRVATTPGYHREIAGILESLW